MGKGCEIVKGDLIAVIEVLFGESEAASMKAAKNKIIVGTVNGPTSVWMAGKKAPPQKPFSGWIEGTSEEVICLGFIMDIGNIREPMESPYRRELIYSMYAQEQWAQDEEIGNELKSAGDFYVKELRRLRDFLDEGESVRIWYSDAPYSRCGLYSLCQILKGYDNQISAVKIPEYVVRDKILSLIIAGVRFRQKSLQFFYPMRSYFQKKKFICMPCCGAFWLRKTALSVRWSIAESSVSRRISTIF